MSDSSNVSRRLNFTFVVLCCINFLIVIFIAGVTSITLAKVIQVIKMKIISLKIEFTFFSDYC